MIRNLKVLILAAMALAVFGATSASSASAAGEKYHCAETSCILTLSPDGEKKESHHVFVVKKGASSGAVTCNGLTATSTSTEATPTVLEVTGLTYATCNLAGTEAKVTTTGCHYTFTASYVGANGQVHVFCSAGKKIEIIAGGCTVEVPGGQTLSGITYTNINSKKEVTVSTNVKNISGTAGAGCAGLLGFTGAFTEGEYTTGNTIVKGFKDESGKEGAQANVWWE